MAVERTLSIIKPDATLKTIFPVAQSACVGVRVEKKR